MRVICISRTIAAGGEAIGKRVAERLGFSYVDEEVIALASKKTHLDPQMVAQAEHRTSILDRLLGAMAVWPTDMPTAAGEFYAPPGSMMTRPVEEELRGLIREAIVEIAARGNAVIVAHAASYALGQQPEVLRVLATASRETRVERLRQSGASATEAAATVRDSDRERAAYLRNFYEVREELPTHYDVVVNTDNLGIERAVEIILTAARG
ncbi:MAG: AAA family ATPase [Candidatus Binatia bacterium]